jgi:hypothetical protein
MSFCREFETTSADILKEEAPPLMVAFLNKLPREIRDLVYGHLCISVDPIQAFLPVKRETPANATFIKSDDRLMNVSYLGDTIAIELSETYWSMNRFEVTLGLNGRPRDGSLDAFLSQGTLRNIKPFQTFYICPCKLIRRLKVNLACEQWECDSRYGEAKMKDYTTGYGLIDDLTFAQAAVSKLEALLAPLSLMAGREELHIEFEIHTMFAQKSAAAELRSSERHFVNIMESLRMCVRALMHSRVHVTLTLSNTDFYEEERGPEKWDITSRFISTPLEWNNVSSPCLGRENGKS